jgi:hypothetical protein
VTVHTRKLVGDYEVTTISAMQPDGLIQWLGTSGFAFDEPDRAVIADYVPKTGLRSPDKADLANALVQKSVLPQRVLNADFSTPRILARNLARFREALERLRRDDDDRWISLYARNNFTGRPRIEEDSPGNYSIRNGPHGVEYLWYDQDGGEHIVQLADLMHVEEDSPPTSTPESMPTY